jgi:hypothetical protein
MQSIQFHFIDQITSIIHPMAWLKTKDRKARAYVEY